VGCKVGRTRTHLLELLQGLVLLLDDFGNPARDLAGSCLYAGEGGGGGRVAIRNWI